MSINLAPPRTRSSRIDAVAVQAARTLSATTCAACLLAVVAGFVALGGGDQEPLNAEAKLALAAGEGVAPFAQVTSAWDPSIPPGQVLAAQAWAWIEGGPPTKGAVRWPGALAAAAIGLLLFRRVGSKFGPRAGLFAALAMLATPAMFDRSALGAFDPLLGLAVLAALDRALARGSGWVAGIWAAAAVMLGGWPGLVAVILPLVVIGRSGSTPSVKLLGPPIAAFLAWSFWACATTRADLWAASLTMPLTRPMAWSLGWRVLRDGLPWTGLLPLLALPAYRAGWSPEAKALLMTWLKVAAVGLLAGTVLPGLDGPFAVAMLAGLAVASAMVLDRLWAGGLPARAGWAAVAVSLVVGLRWSALNLYAGAFLAVAQPYYRGVALALVTLAVLAGLLAIDGLWTRSTRGVVRVLLVAAIGTKLMHGWVTVPELNYRFGKGPWGRAVGQHVPPRWPIYVASPIDPALALATGHPVRRLREPIFLKAQPGDGPKFVLLAGAEFERWPESAPKLREVRTFQDEHGGTRVLARTEGRLVRRDGD